MTTEINKHVVLQLLTVLNTGLLAGLFYGYSCSVNAGLGNLSDDKYLEGFQSINSVILNPLFLVSFMSSAVLLPVSTILTYKSGISISFYLLLSATILYFTGVLGVTIFCNVPLNEKLAGFSIATSTAREISSMRQAFEKPWNSSHAVRTLASVIVFSGVILSVIKQKI